jgi:S-adenosylmethionine:tRNA ribosyltransferase-isomerase
VCRFINRIVTHRPWPDRQTALIYDATVRTSDFDYRLPPDLIAQQPVARGRSKLLVLDRSGGGIGHHAFGDLPDLLDPEDLLLLNDTRVIPARLFARRPTGRRFELLLLRELDGHRWECLLRPGARARAGERLDLADGGEALLVDRRDEGRWKVEFAPALTLERLDILGETPLPPYIERPGGPEAGDSAHYQTVYAANPGAVAAPTAGLHFSSELLEQIAGRGVEIRFVTLHVGLGTFRPVTAERVSEHRMHREWFRFSGASAEAVNRALDVGRRIVCVGTTSVRALEGAIAAGGGRVEQGEAWTDLFITPGFEFRGVGAMLTNFHLPRSTLLMLVAAFAGRERVLDAYHTAIDHRYRFYSYGDAMLIL